MGNPPVLEPIVKPIEPTFLIGVKYEPAWKTLLGNIRDLLFPKRLPPLELTSRPIAVVDRMAVKRDAKSSVISIGIHILIFLCVAVAFILGREKLKAKPAVQVTQVSIQPYLPIAPKGAAMGGGGGGGSHDLVQAPKGKLPKIEQQPVTPPMVIVNEHPKLTQEPAIMLPKNIQIANNNMPNLGDPRTSVVGPASNGTGSMSGMGSGSSGGIGSGNGNGYGPGQGGGTGGGLYHVGGGVSAPELVYSVDPEFSDEARRAKYQGECVVSLVVDAQGNPQRVEVIRHLGMGLDEKAKDAVQHYRFKPAMLNGRPVPVEVDIIVNFRIY